MTHLDLLILSLFTWRGAYLLVKEDAPFRFMARIRAVTTLGGMLDCIYCASLWVALIGLILMSTPLVLFVYAVAASGGAMMMWRYTGGEHG